MGTLHTVKSPKWATLFWVFHKAIGHNKNIHQCYHLIMFDYPLSTYGYYMIILFIIIKEMQHPKVVAHLGYWYP